MHYCHDCAAKRGFMPSISTELVQNQSWWLQLPSACLAMGFAPPGHVTRLGGSRDGAPREWGFR
jgi:hypothetical protein